MTQNNITIGFGRVFRVLASLLLVAGVLVTAPIETQAGPHRARVSRDVADRLAQRVESTSDVIVSAGDAAIDQVAARYGARVKRRIRGGAVLEVTGGQLEALTSDSDVDHIAGDLPVHRMMAVTTEATGADQAWAGLEGLKGVSGRGIGVAVIDSGIAV